MKLRSNFLYVLYSTFSSDLLFWVVIESLFLTTAKGMTGFDILLISMLGLVFTLIFYPLSNLIIKKTSNKTSIIIGSSCYVIAIVMFTLCTTIYGFIIAQVLYTSASLYNQAAAIILKNNLISQGREEDFVKWKSRGWMGYSIITAVIAAVSGIFFNISAYLPMILSIICALISLVVSIIYNEPKTQVNALVQPKTSIRSLVKSKLMILILFMNLFAVGGFLFLHMKSTLLIQSVGESSGLEVAKISLLTSAIIFVSRIVRIVANLIFPKIYSKAKNKANVLILIGILIFVCGICYALGGNLKLNVYINLILIGMGIAIIVFIRDMYFTIENNIIIKHISSQDQKSVLVLTNLYSKIGTLLINGIALLVSGYLSLNVVYLLMTIVTTVQLFICIPLSKYLKPQKQIDQE